MLRGGRKRRLSLMQAAATSPKKAKVTSEELGKMEESINRQKQLDGEGDSDSYSHRYGTYSRRQRLVLAQIRYVLAATRTRTDTVRTRTNTVRTRADTV